MLHAAEFAQVFIGVEVVAFIWLIIALSTAVLWQQGVVIESVAGDKDGPARI